MIIFDRATKQFGDNPPAVEDVSFDVADGEFIFLTGHSGSGKTTLLKLLTKEYVLTDGEIEFDGEPLTKIKNSKIHNHRRKIGVIYQDYRLLPELNVWENIALALEIIGKPQREIEERVTDLLDLVQLSDKAFFFPAELSGGESQRVGIARALATAPNLLLADEPTGNLDPENTLMIARLFDKIHQLGTTVLFATHDLLILDHLGHRRLKMEKGRLIEDTPAKENARKPSTKKDLKTVVKETNTEDSERPVLVHEEAKKEKKSAKEERSGKSTDTEPSVKPSEQKKKKGFGLRLPFFGKKKQVEMVEDLDGDLPAVSEKKLDELAKKNVKSSKAVDIVIEEL